MPRCATATAARSPGRSATRGRGKAVAVVVSTVRRGLRAQHAPCAVALARSHQWSLQLASAARGLDTRGDRN
eukprot:2744020-Alexandrium_andersonii.AAC.1